MENVIMMASKNMIKFTSINLVKLAIPSLMSKALSQKAKCFSCAAITTDSNRRSPTRFMGRRILIPIAAPGQSHPFARYTSTNFKSPNNIIVYECNFRKFLFYTYMFSAGTLVPILSSAAYRMNELMKHMDFGPECFTNLDSPILHMTMVSVLSIALLTGVHSLLNRVLVSIFYDNETGLYSAFRYDALLRLKRVSFGADNCDNIGHMTQRGGGGNHNEPEIVALMKGNLQIHDKKYCVFRKDFSSPQHYNILFGYAPSNQPKE